MYLAASRACVRCGCSKRFDAQGDRVCWCSTCFDACTDWVPVPVLADLEAETDATFKAAVAAYARSPFAPPSMLFNGVCLHKNAVRVRILDCIAPSGPLALALSRGIQSLPSDVLELIFRRLNPPYLGRAMMACTEWADIIRSDPRSTDNGTHRYDPNPDDVVEGSEPDSDDGGGSYCLAGDTWVTMSDGRDVPLSTVRRGHRVALDGGGAAEVECVTVGARPTPTWRAAPGCPRTTSGHPIFLDGAWTTPARSTLREAGGQDIVYNLVLAASEVAYFADGRKTVALGHGFSDAALAHPVYGDREAVLARLRPLPGFAEGLVVCCGCQKM